MDNFFPVLTGISAALLIYWLVYFMLIRHSPDLHTRRIYLSGTAILCLLLPLLALQFDQSPAFTSAGPVQWAELTAKARVFSGELDNVLTSRAHTDWVVIITWIYFGGVTCSLLLLAAEFSFILGLYIYGNREKHSGYVLISHRKVKKPFSFFKWIFVNPAGTHPENYLICHETAHIRGLHSWDNLFVEILRSFLWFHPCAWYYKKYLSEVHEYLADRKVVSTYGHSKAYALYLLSAATGRDQLNLGLGLSNKLITKRIIMLSKPVTATTGKLLLILLIPVSAVVFTACSLLENEDQAVVEVPLSAEEAARTDDYAQQFDGRIINQIVWKGNEALTEDELNTKLGIQPGEIFSSEKVISALSYRETETDVNSWYMNRGYLFNMIEYGVVPVGDDKVNLSFTLYEGQVMKIGSIHIFSDGEELPLLMDYVDIVPGELFNRAKLINANRRLAAATGDLNVSVTPIPYPDRGVVDLEFSVIQQSEN